MKTARLISLELLLVVAAVCPTPNARADDQEWPQLAHDASRAAHAEMGVAPPYRARWIWCGTDCVLRNHSCNASWTNILDTGAESGANYPMPARVPFTFSGRAQPVVAGGKVFIGDLDGRVYCLSLDDGRTLWTNENPGGTCASLAVADGVVVATAIPGGLTG